MREIAALGVDTVVVSWWGPGSVEDTRLRPVAAARARRASASRCTSSRGTAARRIRSRTRSSVSKASASTTCTSTTRRSTPTTRGGRRSRRVPGYRVFAHTSLPGKALKGGFDGLYTYDVLVYDGTSFARMCTSARLLGLACAPSVGPGFDAFRATSEVRIRGRNDGRWYDHMWDSALRAAPDVVTITSYNEWHEGTQIEAASSKAERYETYDGAWGLVGKPAERAYLDRTAYWTALLRSGQFG